MLFANSPASLQELKYGIPKANDGIMKPLCVLVMENLIKKLLSCRRDRGAHLGDLSLLMTYLAFYNVINIKSYCIFKKKHSSANIKQNLLLANLLIMI